MKKYVLVPIAELTDEMIEAVEQTAHSTVRKSKAGTHAALSYEGIKPVCLHAYPEMSQDEVISRLDSDRMPSSLRHPSHPHWIQLAISASVAAMVACILSRWLH